MPFTNEQLYTTAGSIRPHLDSLLGDDATEFKERLNWLLSRSGAGEDVSDALIDLIIRYQTVHAWVADRLQGDHIDDRTTRGPAAGPLATRGDEFVPPSSLELLSLGPEGNPVTARPVKRHLEARSDDSIVMGEVLPLQVRVALDAPVGAGSHEVEIELEIPPEGIDLAVIVHAPGFATSETSLRQLHVPQKDDSAWTFYPLKALELGPHVLLITLFQPGGKQLAELTVTVNVVAETSDVTSVASAAPMASAGGGDGDVALLIDWLDDVKQYRFQFVEQSLPPEVLTERLAQSPRDIVTGLVNRLNAVADRVDVPADLPAWLRDQGIELWTNLVPDEIRSQFWEFRDRITSLRIASRNDPIPWELMYPFARGKDAGFLTQQFPVTRAVRGISQPEQLGDGPVLTVLPGSTPPAQATAECKAVEALWDPTRRDAQVTTLSGLRSSIDGGDFGVLHFACHNSYDVDSVDGARIKFGPNDDFTPVTLASAVEAKTLSETHPLVFLNACTTAGQAASYTDMSGWASRFVEAGAGAFVGSIWKVRDKAARTFAEAFYSELTTGQRTLGSAMKTARSAIESSTDPTWLAYTAYGNANATFN